ncbi:MAG: peptidoglycan editing factor PgeF [Acidobacteria bacterium]|nr:peptidoglycan editing factor PgeF [Acidobacteriota bacterium]
MPVETIITNGSDETLTESGFYWRERNGVKMLVSSRLEAAGFANGFSTRLGGVSAFPENSLNLAGFDEDSAENIEENRRRFLSLFDHEYVLASVWQVHGDGIKDVRTMAEARNGNDKYDAVVSAMPDILAGVKTADCVPVLIGDPVSKSFAAVHAGWRGTVAAITAKAVRKLSDEYGADPENMLAAIGPAASCKSYEIGREVMDSFAKNFSDSGKYFTATREGHALVNLHAANRDQLIAEGISEENIQIAPFCTMERTDLFFSYRVEKATCGKTGRLLSVIGRI